MVEYSTASLRCFARTKSSTFYRLGPLVYVITLLIFVNEANGQCKDTLEIALDAAPSVNITSPGYPDFHENNLNCNWRLTYPNGQGVTVRFFDVHTEQGYDFLILAPSERDNSTADLTFHGDISPPRTLYLQWRELWVRFTSDGAGNRRGFSIQVTAAGSPTCLDNEFSCVYQTTYQACLERHRRCDYVMDCDDASDETGCGLCFDDVANITSDKSLIMITPGYPMQYPASLECNFYVKAPMGYSIVFTIINFRIELEFDFVLIKPTVDATQSASLTLSGDSSPDVIYTNSDEIWLVFETDSWTQYEGFKIVISAELLSVSKCSGGLWDCYQTYLTCYSRTYLCDLHEECPNGVDELNCPETVTVVNVAPGNTATITSPSHPFIYSDNIDIQWQILSPPGSFIRLIFLNFSIAINEDFLYIQLNDSRIETHALKRFTGIEAEKAVLVSETDEVWLRFVAGDSVAVSAGMGFVITLTVEERYQCALDEFGCNQNGALMTCLDAQVECNFSQECMDASDEGPQCGFCWNPIFNIEAAGTKLRTLFSPFHYPPTLRCFAQISVPTNHGIKLVLLDLLLPDQNELVLSNNYIDEISVSEANEGMIALTDKIMSVINFRSDVWLGFVAVLNNVTTGFEIELSRFLTGDMSTRECGDNALLCSTLMPSAVVCFNSTVRCDSIIHCPDYSDEQGCDIGNTTPHISTPRDIKPVMPTTTSLMTTQNSPTTMPASSILTSTTQETTTGPNTSALPSSRAPTMMATTTPSTTSPYIRYTSQTATDGVIPGPVDTIDTCSESLIIVDVPSKRRSRLITSPGYPITGYDDDLSCQWLLVAELSKGIVLTINDLVLENGFDFLTIYNKESNVILSLTGQTKITQISSNDTCLVEFTSDKTVTSKGFSIEITQYESVPPQCRVSDYRCENTFCVDQSARCNGIDDCRDLSDENGCDEVDCRDLLQCGDVCIDEEQICDGIASCPTGEDEESCVENKCPEDCDCIFNNNGELSIVCLRGWLRAMSGGSDLPKVTKELEIKAERDFLQPGVFKTLKNLQKLTLLIGGTKSITEIPLCTFDRQDQLTFLNVTNLGSFEVLSKDIFRELSSLKVLVLWFIGNVEFEVDVFNGLESLQTLVIVKGDPQIDMDPSLTADHVNGLPRLETIYVDDIQICCDIKESVTCVSLKASYSASECGPLLGNTFFRSMAFFWGFLALIGNLTIITLLVIYNTYKYLKFNIIPVQYILITNLSVAYLFMALYLLIIAIQDVMLGPGYQSLSRSWQSSLTCSTAALFAFLSSETSLGIMLLLSIDRFLNLFAPLQRFKLTRRSATGSSLVVWCCCIILSVVFSSLVGPEDNNNFGLSGVCFSIPFFIKPNKYTISVDDFDANQVNFDLPVFNQNNTAAWNFISSVFYGLNFASVILIISIWISIGYFAINKYRYNAMQYSDEIKLCIRVAPLSLLTIVCWLIVIMTGLLSMNAENMVSMTAHSFSVLFILPLGSSLGPILYGITLYFTKLENNEISPESDEQGAHKKCLVTGSHESIAIDLQLKNPNNNTIIVKEVLKRQDGGDVNSGFEGAHAPSGHVNAEFEETNGLPKVFTETNGSPNGFKGMNGSPNGVERHTLLFQDGCEYATIGPVSRAKIVTLDGATAKLHSTRLHSM